VIKLTEAQLKCLRELVRHNGSVCVMMLMAVRATKLALIHRGLMDREGTYYRITPAGRSALSQQEKDQ